MNILSTRSDPGKTTLGDLGEKKELGRLVEKGPT